MNDIANKPTQPGLGAPPAGIDGKIYAYLDKVREILEVGTGQRSYGELDKFLTFRDLEKRGLVNFDFDGLGSPDYPIITPPDPNGSPWDNTAKPGAPTNLTAAGAMNYIVLKWENWEQQVVSYTEIWRSAEDNLGTAVLSGTSNGMLYSDPVGPSSSYYYWVRFVSYAGRYSDYNSLAGTLGETADDPQQILDLLWGRLTETELYAQLNSRINLIDAPVTGLIDQLDHEIVERTNEVAALQTQIDSVSASISANVFVHGFEDADIGNWVIPTDNTLVQGTTPLFGAKSATATYNGSGEPAMLTECLRLPIPPSAVVAFSGAQVRCAVFAQEAAANPAATFGLGITTPTEDSTFTTFSLTSAFAKYEFVYEMPAGLTESDACYVCVWADTANSGKGVLLDQITVDISGSVQDLSGITANANAISVLDARVTQNTTSISANASAITAIDSVVSDPTTGVVASAAAVNSLTTAVSANEAGITANAQELGQIQAIVGSDYAALQELKDVVVGPDGLSASYTLKLDVNGYVTGFGTYNDGLTSAMYFNVDYFYITKPNATSLAFVVDATENRVVMDGALIKSASITSAQIGSLNADLITGDTANFVIGNIGEGTITNAKIGNYIQSANYENGYGGWRIDKSGVAEFHAITIYNSLGEILLRSGTSPEDILNAGVGNNYFNPRYVFWDEPGGAIPPVTVGGNIQASQEGDEPKIKAIAVASGLNYCALGSSLEDYNTRIPSRRRWLMSFEGVHDKSNAQISFYVRENATGQWVGSSTLVHTTANVWQKYVVEVDLSASGAEKVLFRFDNRTTGVFKYDKPMFEPMWGEYYSPSPYIAPPISRITDANINTYIKGAAIDTAQIKLAAIDTLLLKGNAVNITETYFNAASFYIWQSTVQNQVWAAAKTIELTHTTSRSSVAINFSCGYYQAISGLPRVYVDIYRNFVLIHTRRAEVPAVPIQSIWRTAGDISVNYVDTPGDGQHSYLAVVRSEGSEWYVHNRYLALAGTLR